MARAVRGEERKKMRVKEQEKMKRKLSSVHRIAKRAQMGKQFKEILSKLAASSLDNN